MRAIRQSPRGLLQRAHALLAAGLLAAGLASAHAAPPALSAGEAPAATLPGYAHVVLPAGSFIALSYHEVRDEVRDYPDPYAVDSAALVAQFAWLRGNGYTPVSLGAIIAARQGGKPLPPKAVLLTFDDGYLSFYTRVYPLLREFNYPALLAIVGKWIEQPAGQAGVAYGEKGTVMDASFPTWAQLREMAASGLVEMASHSYDLHRGVIANPQGNVQPAATARIYDPATGMYEGDEQWRSRVRDDLARNMQLIERGTGQRPRAMVWPYGSYNSELVGIARELGMPVGVTLDDGANTPQMPLAAMRRVLLAHNPPLADFVSEMRGPLFAAPVRVLEVALDGVYDADPARQEQKLSTLLDRVLAMRPTHVYLSAFSNTPAGMAAYFPTRGMPVRADLFNRVAWQLATRSDVKVYAAIQPALLNMPPAAATAIVEDLARHANFDGLYFSAPEPTGTGNAAFEAATGQLTAAARRWRAPVMLARGLGAVADPAQAIATLAPGADFIVLTDAAAALPVAPSGAQRLDGTRLVVMLDGNAPPFAGGAQLAERMRALQRGGVLNFGYRGDDFLHDQPPLAQVAPALSVRLQPR